MHLIISLVFYGLSFASLLSRLYWPTFFLLYGWFLLNLGKDCIRTKMKRLYVYVENYIKVEMKVLSKIKSMRTFQQDVSSLKLHVFWIECTIYFNVLLNNFVNFCRKSYILGRRIQFEHSKFQRKCHTAELSWIVLCPPFHSFYFELKRRFSFFSELIHMYLTFYQFS